MIIETSEHLDGVDFHKGNGIIPMIVQDVDTGGVRMLGYADREALEMTLSTGEIHFRSRTRATLWRKGETSGNTLALVSLHLDCDHDTALALVKPKGPTCHLGSETCFGALPFLARLAEVIEDRSAATSAGEAGESYTAKLLQDRNLRLKKITEEAGELAIACADDDSEQVAAEAADLIYHALVACRASGVRLDDVVRILRERHS